MAGWTLAATVRRDNHAGTIPGIVLEARTWGSRILAIEFSEYDSGELRVVDSGGQQISAYPYALATAVTGDLIVAASCQGPSQEIEMHVCDLTNGGTWEHINTGYYYYDSPSAADELMVGYGFEGPIGVHGVWNYYLELADIEALSTGLTTTPWTNVESVFVAELTSETEPPVVAGEAALNYVYSTELGPGIDGWTYIGGAEPPTTVEAAGSLTLGLGHTVAASLEARAAGSLTLGLELAAAARAELHAAGSLTLGLGHTVAAGLGLAAAGVLELGLGHTVSTALEARAAGALELALTITAGTALEAHAAGALELGLGLAASAALELAAAGTLELELELSAAARAELYAAGTLELGLVTEVRADVPGLEPPKVTPTRLASRAVRTRLVIKPVSSGLAIKPVNTEVQINA